MGPLNKSPLITHDYKGAPRSTWSADAIQVLLEPLSLETVRNFTSFADICCRHLLPTKLIRGGDNLNSEQEELIRMMMDRRRAHLPIK